MDGPFAPQFQTQRQMSEEVAYQHAVIRRLTRKPRVIVAIGAVLVGIWAIGAGVDLLGELLKDPALVAASDLMTRIGAKDNHLIEAGEWWRLVTSFFLHAGLLHVAMNTLALVVFGRLVESAFGPARTFLLFLGAGLGGAIASWTFVEGLSVGASGAIMGLAGAFHAFLWRQRDHMPRALGLQLRKSTAWPVVMTFGLGFLVPGIDNAAHIGGYLSGFVLALPLGQRVFAEEVPARSRLVMPLVWLGLLATVASVAFAIEGAFGWMHVPEAVPERFVVDGESFTQPLGWTSGILTRTGCITREVSRDAVLMGGGTLCYRDERGMEVYIGRRERLLTLDDEDFSAMESAARERAFVVREPSYAVYPVGDRWLYVLHGPDALLAHYGRALSPILPEPGRVDRKLRARQPLPFFDGTPGEPSPDGEFETI